MHIDTTFVPLEPGKVLVNPEYIDVDRLPGILNSWDVLIAPEPDPIDERLLSITSMCGKWLSMNVLMVDEKRVIAERHHTGMLRALEQWGFEPIPCDLLYYAPFGGSFHCATLDAEAPDEWPRQVQGPGDLGLLDHEQSVGVARALLGVLGHVRGPEVEGRTLGALRDQVECLVGVFGADGHDVAGVTAADPFRGQQAGSAVPLPSGVGWPTCS
jgi:hypothetical protein